MQDEPSRSPPALSGHRSRTVDELCAHFAADRLTVDEFERRVDAAHRAVTLGELKALTSDLAALEPKQPVAAPAREVVPEPESRQLLFAVMAGTERRGRWRPARQVSVFALMGGAELDFREAQLPPGETEVFIVCIMGGAEIIVPPNLQVDASGVAIMGGFAHSHADPPPADADAPVLRIRGFCLMGGVDIVTRLPGESAKDAKRRRRDEQRRLQRGS
jgi:hypothetical protein